MERGYGDGAHPPGILRFLQLCWSRWIPLRQDSAVVAVRCTRQQSRTLECADAPGRYDTAPKVRRSHHHGARRASYNSVFDSPGEQPVHGGVRLQIFTQRRSGRFIYNLLVKPFCLGGLFFMPFPPSLPPVLPVGVRSHGLSLVTSQPVVFLPQVNHTFAYLEGLYAIINEKQVCASFLVRPPHTLRRVFQS